MAALASCAQLDERAFVGAIGLLSLDESLELVRIADRHSQQVVNALTPPAAPVSAAVRET